MSQDSRPPIRSLRCTQAMTDTSHFCGIVPPFFVASLSSCLCQKPALRGTLVPPVPLIVTDLFLALNQSSAHFLIHFAPLSSSLQLLLRLLRLMKVNWPVPFLLCPQQTRALLGVFFFFFFFRCSLYRVCGCWANSCGSVLTETFLL